MDYFSVCFFSFFISFLVVKCYNVYINDLDINRLLDIVKHSDDDNSNEM